MPRFFMRTMNKERYTHNPRFDVEAVISPPLAEDRRAQEHIHRAAIPPQRIQTSHGDYGSELVQIPQSLRPRIRREQPRRWFIRDMEVFRPCRESADIRFRCNTRDTITVNDRSCRLTERGRFHGLLLIVACLLAFSTVHRKTSHLMGVSSRIICWCSLFLLSFINNLGTTIFLEINWIWD